MKICNICKIEKDEACFYKRTASKDGLSLKCKSCCKKYDKQYQQDNKEHIKEQKKQYSQDNKETLKEYIKQWRETNKDKIKEKGKQYHQINKERIRKCYLTRKYSITIEQVKIMLKEQDNKCAICNTEFENIIEKPGKVKVGYNVDHDHTTGSVRGLLCSKCNRSIGLLQDSIEVLESAVKYLKKYKEEPTHETENS